MGGKPALARVLAGAGRCLSAMCGLAGRCAACGAASGCGADGLPPLCAECRESLQLYTGPACPACGELEHTTVCPRCLADPPPWERVYFVRGYEGLLKQLIHGYKFTGGLHREQLLGALLAEAVRGSKADVVVPVPLHPRRLISRGYNQSLGLARHAARALGAKMESQGLRRVRRTTPQAELDRQGRLGNLKGAFAARQDVLDGHTVLLVDDVMTTGATLRECACALLEAGAARVEVAVLARA